MSGHEDDGTCERCSKPVHLLHDPPCEHGICVCDTCWKGDACPDCRADSVADMFATGRYDPRADPLVNHNAPPSVDRIARAGGYQWDGGWTSVPSKEKDA